MGALFAGCVGEGRAALNSSSGNHLRRRAARLTVLREHDTILLTARPSRSSFFPVFACDKIHKVDRPRQRLGPAMLTQTGVLPIFLFALFALAAAGGMVLVGMIFGPRRQSGAKRMPYESGMDPIHDARRRFDVRFHLVAIAFLIFDVELLFIYPWAVATKNPAGIDAAVAADLVGSRGIVFGGLVVFMLILIAGLVYDWRKGVLQWR